MTSTTLATDIRNIVVSEVFPHSPAIIWKALSDAELMSRWLMPPVGFAPIVGQAFTFQTKAAGRWDGTIHCKVLEVVASERLAFSWRGGDEANVGYGSKLDTIVTFTLTAVEGGTRVRLVHSGFQHPRNDTAFENMERGWKTVVARLDQIATGEG